MSVMPDKRLRLGDHRGGIPQVALCGRSFLPQFRTKRSSHSQSGRSVLCKDTTNVQTEALPKLIQLGFRKEGRGSRRNNKPILVVFIGESQAFGVKSLGDPERTPEGLAFLVRFLIRNQKCFRSRMVTLATSFITVLIEAGLGFLCQLRVAMINGMCEDVGDGDLLLGLMGIDQPRHDMTIQVGAAIYDGIESAGSLISCL